MQKFPGHAPQTASRFSNEPRPLIKGLTLLRFFPNMQ